MFKISVIIPAYNAEKYIGECLDSVFAQTFSDFEVIVINDGSTDFTREILSRYEKKHGNLIVKDIDNHGQGYARNLGVRIASGEYIQFVDADDLISPFMMEFALERIEADKSDLVFTNWSRFDDIHNIEMKVRKKTFIDDYLLEGDACRKLYELRPYYTVTSIYRKSFLLNNDLTFGEGYFYEDAFFWMKVVNCVRKASIIKDNLYRVRYHLESSTQTSWSSDVHTKSFIKLVEESNRYGIDNANCNFNQYYEYLVDRFFIYYRDRVSEDNKINFAKDFLTVWKNSVIRENAQMSDDLKAVLDFSKEDNWKGLCDYSILVQSRKEEKKKIREKETVVKTSWIRDRINSYKNNMRYKYINEKKDENKFFVDGKIGAKDIIEIVNSLELDIEQTSYVVVDNKIAAEYKKTGLKVNLVKQRTPQYFRQLYTSGNYITDTELFSQYVKSQGQKVIVAWDEDVILERFNTAYAFDRIQRTAITSDYVFCENCERMRTLIRQLGIINIFRAEILTKGENIKQKNITKKINLLCFDSFNEIIEISRAVVALERNQQKSNNVFFANAGTIFNNPMLLKKIIKNNSVITYHNKYFEKQISEEIEIRQLFPEMELEKVILNGTEINDVAHLLKHIKAKLES